MMEDEAPPQWFTESQRPRFDIGSEVVVTLSECPRGVHHGDQERGVRGMVIGVDGGHGAPEGHPIWVHYRGILPVKGRSGFYAPGELEPFDVQAESQRL